LSAVMAAVVIMDDGLHRTSCCVFGCLRALMVGIQSVGTSALRHVSSGGDEWQ